MLTLTVSVRGGVDCREARSYFLNLLDRELTAEPLEELTKHLFDCQHCFAQAEFERILRKLIKKRYDPHPLDTFQKKMQDFVTLGRTE